MIPELVIDLAKQFSPTPGGRYAREGEWSGEEFRTKLLVPALERADVVVVDLDGAVGFPSSFLDEVFGGIVLLLRADAFRRVVPRSVRRPNRQKRARMYMDRALKELG